MKQKVNAIITITYEVEVDYPESWNDNEIENDLKENYGEYIDESEASIDVSIYDVEVFKPEPEDNTYSGGIYE